MVVLSLPHPIRRGGLVLTPPPPSVRCLLFLPAVGNLYKDKHMKNCKHWHVVCSGCQGTVSRTASRATFHDFCFDDQSCGGDQLTPRGDVAGRRTTCSFSLASMSRSTEMRARGCKRRVLLR